MAFFTKTPASSGIRLYLQEIHDLDQNRTTWALSKCTYILCEQYATFVAIGKLQRSLVHLWQMPDTLTREAMGGAECGKISNF
ncbi:MAG: hypothetical protein AAGD12_16350 [Pseudomonadota bacterium]